MTAGRGIVHAECTPRDLVGTERRSRGLQLWAALPAADEAMARSFAHTPAAAIPALEVGGAQLRVLVGSAFGATSPVVVRSPTLYLDLALDVGDALPLPEAAERALDGVDGAVELDGEPLGPRHLWWYFVSTRQQRIAQAADDWAALRFAAVPGETDFIPLCDRRT